jgi:DNA-binding PadR family transcriptional regulator
VLLELTDALRSIISESDIEGRYMLRDFFLGFIKVHILHHAAQEPVYGLALIQELRRHGYVLGPGTLYPVLHSMEKAGYLTRDDRVVGGRVRKYYEITDAGRTALAETREKIVELVREVVEGEGPTHLADPDDPEEGV